MNSQPTRVYHWPHAPLHRLCENGTYFVTASTFNKVHHFRDRARLEVLHRGLLSVAHDSGWHLEAWAVFSNHYHFVAHSPPGDGGATSLSPMLQKLHSKTARWINALDDAPRRQVWYNFWETELTESGAYLARLNYTHNNAVKHGLVSEAASYPWCSASWFNEHANYAQRSKVLGMKWDRVKVYDDFEPVVEGWGG